MQIITDQSPLRHSQEDSEHEQMEDSKMHKCARVASVNLEVPSLSSEEVEGGERLPKAGQCHVQTSPLLPTLGDARALQPLSLVSFKRASLFTQWHKGEQMAFG